jgi:glycosyltransferase involved in cell wall biosynthesis
MALRPLRVRSTLALSAIQPKACADRRSACRPTIGCRGIVMRRLRILYHHRTQGRGAEGNHIVSIVTAMRAEGHQVDVLSPPGIDPFDPGSTIPVDSTGNRLRGWSSIWKAVSCHLPSWLFEIAELAYNIPSYLRLRKALRAQKYDLLFERYASYLVAGAVAARRAGCLFALEINDVSGVPNRVRPQHFPRLCSAVERWLLKRCDLAHAVSSYLGDRLVEVGVPAKRVVVVPNGFDIERIRISMSRAQMRTQQGFTEEHVVIGFAGWFVPWDRLDFMVEVFAEAHRQLPQLRLCLVGDGDPAREIIARLQGTDLEGAVVLTGGVPRARVYDYIQMFDIGMLPHSNPFGSPIVMFEMMGLKVPVLAPRLPPIEDVHVNDETALLFQPLDRQECLGQLLRLGRSDELRNQLSERAFIRLGAEHTWRRTAQRILAALPQSPAAQTSTAAPQQPERAP